MAQIGTIVQSQEVPPAVINVANTGTAFMVGFADWGPVGASGVTTPVNSLTQAAALLSQPNGGLTQLGRTATNATLYDSADVFFREGGGNLYLSRVLGPNPTAGTLALQDTTGANTITLTAAYLGPGSSAINAVVTNAGSSYTLVIQDALGNPLASSPSLVNTNKADAIAWAAGTGLVTATAGNANLPKTVGTIGAPATNPLSTGIDDHANATITQWTSALNGGLPAALGPGQVMAPNQNNTNLSGIWSALANHAASNNRVALLDGKDGNTATQAIAEVTTAALPSSLQGYCGIWTGNLQIPGIASGTTRIIPPSPVVAALCTRVDNGGNPNLAAAGVNYSPQYVSGINTAYTNPLTGDIANLNNSGINVFSNVYGILQNYGFVTAIALPSNDAIYWQLSHARLRMAIVAQAQVIGQAYLFSQLDGAGKTISEFAGALNGMLLGFYAVGALYGATASDAFIVNANATINTPASIAAGNLIGQLAVRMSPFTQLVQITINAISITQTLIQPSSVNA